MIQVGAPRRGRSSPLWIRGVSLSFSLSMSLSLQVSQIPSGPQLLTRRRDAPEPRTGCSPDTGGGAWSPTPDTTRSAHAPCVIPGSGFLVLDWSVFLITGLLACLLEANAVVRRFACIPGCRLGGLTSYGCDSATLIYKST
ncbi:hypothetical protein ASPVEDRAFT_484243 [Aspergillus versicolor CBS 583.65]|uniref:Uncharacterized protein n=1 Tax=Aspergillus versicolor CBS 583.65 TaxID=1036611 RepID=A0A1L9PB98_ASPVE|nr:uncharacterized protein ASPVEDRAFT_484243 [Aspergillus versicolor CBS 583.65]OJI98791.1 hypothetical protein ASPVEDRAFT_484243 [Aspergillus versicolor CBS 583.65]